MDGILDKFSLKPDNRETSAKRLRRGVMSSVLAKVFSSKLVRGAYPDEKTAVDFQMEGSARERKRLSSMINREAKASPFGKTVLETAAKDGYTLAFATSGISVAGSCCEKK